MMLRQHCAIPVQFTHHEKNTTFSLSFLAGSKFPFVNNNMQQQQQNPMQSNQQWPGMHMGFNQNTNDGGFPHPNNQQQQQQQHKPTGEHIIGLSSIESDYIVKFYIRYLQDLVTASPIGAHCRSIQPSCHFVNFPSSIHKVSNPNSSSRAAMIISCPN